MRIIGTILGKGCLTALRLTGRSGSALPGLVVEKVSPKYLQSALATLPQGVIVVSGTNGKTTTTSILVKLLESQGLRVLTNETGSNFVRGAISAVVQKSTWGGKLPYDIAVFEQDEAHAVHFAKAVKPRGVLLLNVTRDQMDRFGEIDTTTKMLSKLAAAAKEWVVLNANDERVGAIAIPSGVKTARFAHSEAMRHQFTTDDELYSTEPPKHVLLGEPDVWLEGYDSTGVTIRAGDNSQTYITGLLGIHNAFNLLAAYTAFLQIIPKPDQNKLVEAIGGLSPVFGRGEMVKMPSGGNLTLQLIKNPSGFRQALKVMDVKEFATSGIAINDDYADGRDVSWLWDVAFDSLKGRNVFCGGVRAADMANRLKYDEVEASYEPDLKGYLGKLDIATAKGEEAILFCTYTAMRQIRVELLGAASGLEEMTS